MPLASFLMFRALEKCGYRPVRFRPYLDGSIVKVAGVWTRDRRNSRIESGVSAEEIRRLDQKNRSEKFIPVDVASYISKGDRWKARGPL